LEPLKVLAVANQIADVIRRVGAGEPPRSHHLHVALLALQLRREAGTVAGDAVALDSKGPDEDHPQATPSRRLCLCDHEAGERLGERAPFSKSAPVTPLAVCVPLLCTIRPRRHRATR
jgi:hypothetical protein